ncbi:MAG: hypothetical protein LUD72_11335 [Bacteroidales bacterium]|nr:hypothetical protein [Bacteroidales bacterium]
MTFRDLNASDIECRIAIVKQNGVSLLLYKDARCDMSVLDETVGPENWQRNHEVINGNLFCNVGIRVEDEWVWKQDVGVESYTEKEKGQASDAFKRACVNWGIGRELYTAPFIWITSKDAEIKQDEKGKYKCYDRFEVGDIEIADKRIVSLTITKKGKTVYQWMDGKISPAQIKVLEEGLEHVGRSVEGAIKFYGVKDLADLTTTQYTDLMKRINNMTQAEQEASLPEDQP